MPSAKQIRQAIVAQTFAYNDFYIETDGFITELSSRLHGNWEAKSV